MIETGRHALVIGYGRSGRAAAAFIRRRGGTVRVVDRADTPELRAELERPGIAAGLGGYGAQDLDGVDKVSGSDKASGLATSLLEQQ